MGPVAVRPDRQKKWVGNAKPTSLGFALGRY
jgi:hypothetical protein